MDDRTLLEMAAKMASEWWIERLKPRHAHHAPKLAEEIRSRVLQELRGECYWDWWGERHEGAGHENECRIEFDYDPHGLLIPAWAEATGLPGWESRDAWPIKHSLDVTTTELRPKEGYGNWTAAIPIRAASEIGRTGSGE